MSKWLYLGMAAGFVLAALNAMAGDYQGTDMGTQTHYQSAHDIIKILKPLNPTQQLATLAAAMAAVVKSQDMDSGANTQAVHIDRLNQINLRRLRREQ